VPHPADRVGRDALSERWEWFARSVRSVIRYFGSFLGIGGIGVARIPSGPVPDSLAREIETFEKRIATAYIGGVPTVCDQGRDYTLFWRAIGDGAAFAARDRAGRVVGVCAVARLRLRMPTGRERSAAYLAHLRVLPECRSGVTIPSLIARTVPSIMRSGFAGVGFSADAAGFNPGRVARNLGLPAFKSRGAARLITFDTSAPLTGPVSLIREAPEPRVRAAYADFTKGYISSRGGTPALRSTITPRWLMAEDGSACGCLEDYHKARRWRMGDSGEIVQSHISFFGWQDFDAAARFVRACIVLARDMGVPRVRISADDRLADAMVAAIGITPQSVFRWNIYGAGLGPLPDAPWSVHPTEF